MEDSTPNASRSAKHKLGRGIFRITFAVALLVIVFYWPTTTTGHYYLIGSVALIFCLFGLALWLMRR